MTAPAPAPHWFREHFTADYRLIYGARNQSAADREAACIARELSLGPGDRVLDLCCGFGRHLAAFERLGVRAVGLDLSRELLAQASSATSQRLVCGDMRWLPFPSGSRGFTAVVNFFTSFGYFEHEAEHFQAAREIARVLVPGGRFAVDLFNPGPTLAALIPLSERSVDGLRILERRRRDDHRRRVEKEIEVHEPDGQVRVYRESVRFFDQHEIVHLFGQVGLSVERTLGDFTGEAAGSEAPRMILLGRRES